MQVVRRAADGAKSAEGGMRQCSAMHSKGGQDRNHDTMAAARKRLLPLIDATHHSIDDYVDMLRQSPTIRDFERCMVEQIGWGSNYNYVLGPLMMKLYAADAGTRQFIDAETKNLGVSSEAIELYFRMYIVHGALGIEVNPTLRGLIPDWQRDGFVEFADQLMLDALRRHIGLETRRR